MARMDPSLWRRLRWGNISRAIAGVALVALVVAWPRLAGPVERVPDARVRPLVGVAPPASGLAHGQRDRPPAPRLGGVMRGRAARRGWRPGARRRSSAGRSARRSARAGRE